ncbi:MAG: ImcF-related family protein [Pseudomonadota bacterium]
MKNLIKKGIAVYKKHWILITALLIAVIVALVLWFNITINTFLSLLIFIMSIIGIGLCIAGLLYLCRYLIFKSHENLREHYDQQHSRPILKDLVQKKQTDKKCEALYRALMQISKKQPAGLKKWQGKKNIYLIIDESNKITNLLALSAFNQFDKQQFESVNLWYNTASVLIVLNTLTDPLSIYLLKILRDYRYNHYLKAIFLTQQANAIDNDNDEHYLKNQQKDLATLHTCLKRFWQRTFPPCYLLVTELENTTGFEYVFAEQSNTILPAWLGVFAGENTKQANQTLLQQLQTQAFMKMPNQPEQTAQRFLFIEKLASLFQQSQSRLLTSANKASPCFTAYLFTGRQHKTNHLCFFDGIFSQFLPQQRVAAKKQCAAKLPQKVLAVFIVLAVLWAGLSTASFINNNQRLTQVKRQLSNYKGLIRVNNMPEAMKRLATAMAITQVFHPNQDNFWLHNGLYQGKRINHYLTSLYQQDLSQWFIPTLAKGLSARMRQAAPHSAQLVSSLKAYLMLAKPEHFNASVMNTVIKQQLPAQVSHSIVDSPNLMTLLTAMQRSGFPPLSPQTKLVSQKQVLLPNLTPIIFHGLLQDAAKKLGQEKQFATDQDKLLFAQPPQINPLYTKKGYDYYRHHRRQIIIATLNQQWFYGINPYLATQQLTDYQQKLDEMYARHYIQAWQTLLQQTKIKYASNLDNAIKQLKVSAAINSPILKLLGWVNAQTLLVTRKQSADDPGARISQTFDPLHQWLEKQNRHTLQSLSKQMNGISQYLSKIKKASDPSQAALKQLQADFKSNHIAAYQKLQNHIANMPTPAKNWLQQLMASSLTSVLTTATTAINAVWQNQVDKPYATVFANDFPFQPSAQAEISTVQFSKLFAPGGILPAFLQTYIAPFIDLHQGQYYQLYGAHLPISKTALQLLTRLQAITDDFFKQGKLQVAFSLTPVFLSEQTATVRLNLLDQHLIYQHGPAIAKTFQWPTSLVPTETALIWTIFQQPAKKTTEVGDWAWLRLLQQGTITSTENPKDWLLRFDHGDQNAQFKLEGGAAIAFVANNTFSQLALPQQL